MDVEPLGDEYVTSMCHDIEDPTFDATAVATNPRARMRPIHRPPRTPADRQPHCAWTVTIEESHPPVAESEGCRELRGSRAAGVELDPIEAVGEGLSDYTGPLRSDLVFADFSQSALVRIADEVCLQMQLLNLGFVRAVAQRADAAQAKDICAKQLLGIAGVAAERIHRALGLSSDVDGALRVLELHPLVNPAAYVNASVGRGALRVRESAAHADGGWISLCGPEQTAPLQAIVRAVDPHFDVEVRGDERDWTARVTRNSQPAKEFGEVSVTKVSSGAGFVFQPRRSIPITPVGS
jgi:hypothetical protein